MRGLSFHPIINPWIKCKLTRSEYDDSIDEILESCQLKFDTDGVQTKGAMDLSEDDSSESGSESSVLDMDIHDDDKELSDDNLSSDHIASRLRRISRGGFGGDRGASFNGGDDDNDLDLLKKRARLLHSQETGRGGSGSDAGEVRGGARGGASLMPKLDLADPGERTSRLWDFQHPSSSSSTSLHWRHSLPLLPGNQASG